MKPSAQKIGEIFHHPSFEKNESIQSSQTQ